MNLAEISSDIPLFANDTIIFGVLCVTLALIFYTSSLPRFSKFYSIVPSLLLCYFIPSVLSSVGLIADKWIDVTATINHLQALYGNLDGVTNLETLKEYAIANNINPPEYSKFIGGSKLYYVS